MDAVVSRPAIILSRRRLISCAVIGLSVGMTGVMSLLFHHELRPDMLATGFICAIVVDQMVRRITRHFRRQLASVNERLERRVIERTAELAGANQALRDAAAKEASLRTELHAKDRLATAGMVVAGVNHEIRSPLAVITLAVDEVAELLGKTSADVDEVLGDIRASAAHINVILRDLSAITRPGDEPVAAVALGPVVDSAVRLASYKLGHGVKLERGTLDVPEVTGNSSRLVQVVLNLVVNAARATQPGVPNTIRVAARATESTVILAIADTGTGMSAETQARLFEPFFTTGATTGGTGLGLAICRQIVERMGGTIAITSALGSGTTVEVTLQRAPTSASSARSITKR